MILISQVFNHFTIASLFWRTLLVHCLLMFSDVSLRVILFQKNSKAVRMHDLKKKKSLKYLIFQKEAKKEKIIKQSLGLWIENNDLKSKHLESSQRGHLKGELTQRRLPSAFQREITRFQVCIPIIQLWLQQPCPPIATYLGSVIGIGVRKWV